MNGFRTLEPKLLQKYGSKQRPPKGKHIETMQSSPQQNQLPLLAFGRDKKGVMEQGKL